MASIMRYRTKQGTKYKVRVQLAKDELTGNQIIKSKQGFNSRQEAEVYAVSLLQETTKETPVQTYLALKEAKKHTFNELYLKWFENYKLTVKESTWVTTQRNFRLHILPYFGRKNISEITDDYVQKVLNKWYRDKLRNYKRFLTSTSIIFKYAMRKHYVDTNPADNVIVPRQESHLHIMADNYYSKEELQKFLECVYESSDFKIYTFFRLLAFTGMRKGEALALTWSDINFKAHTISVSKTQSRGMDGINIQSTKTSESLRNVYADKKTFTILRKWKREQQEWLLQSGYIKQKSQLIFQNQFNKMYQPVKPRTWMIRVVNEYNLKQITIHGFRHTYATLAYEAGLSVKQLQHQLGHRNIQTTLDIYTSITRQQKNDIADKYSSYLQF